MMLAGAKAFELHDTHGLPIEMTYLECKDRGVGVDMAGFCAAATKAGWKPRRLLALAHEGWMSADDKRIVNDLYTSSQSCA